VFAIAITLLVIELKLPPLDTHDTNGLLQSLARMIPNFIGFFISFFVIGAFWSAHHRVFRWVARCDDRLLWRNLLFLLLIAFLPFPTAVMSEHPRLPAAALFYTAVLAVAALNQLRLWHYALRTPGIVLADAPPAAVRRYFRRATFVFFAAILAGALCLVIPGLPVMAFFILPLATRIATLAPVEQFFERRSRPPATRSPAR
jgi:uncharacterized membrane protein